jgi:hypothetical protein
MPNLTCGIVAYWLCPAEPARSHFCAIISDLAARFDAPIFEPHLTIYVTKSSDENPDTVFARVLKNCGGHRLSVRGLDYSDKFTKTLFVQFEPDAEVTRLSSDLRCASAEQNDYELNPHLSLIYKTMTHETKLDLTHSIRLPFTEVCFDALKAVISPACIKSREDVEAWRVVATEQLFG